MTTIEKNTELFYKELNGNCDVNNLLKIAKEGIFLYESLCKHDKLKNHDYVIDISILARQYFMINTETQYTRFFEIMKNFEKYNIFSIYENRYDCGKLIIINKFFINKLMEDKNEEHIFLIINSYSSILILKNLFKYNLINAKCFYFFITNCSRNHKITFEIIDYFYFNKNNYVFDKYRMSYSFNEIFALIERIIEIGYDINMLNYCVNLLEDYNVKMSSYCINNFKICLNFPLKTLQEFSNKIYMPNQFVLKHEDKYFETLINTVISDNVLYSYVNSPSFIYNIYNIDKIKRYNINLDKMKELKIKIENPKSVKLFKINCNSYYEFKKYKFYNSKSKNEKKFSKDILTNNIEVENILNDSNYIFTLDINFNKEVLLIQICYIISLIHNNYNKFIIMYLISFLKISRYIFAYENNKIVIYCTNDEYINSYYYIALTDITHKVFRSYIEFKEVDNLPLYRENDQDKIIFPI